MGRHKSASAAASASPLSPTASAPPPLPPCRSAGPVGRLRRLDRRRHGVPEHAPRHALDRLARGLGAKGRRPQKGLLQARLGARLRLGQLRGERADTLDPRELVGGQQPAQLLAQLERARVVLRGQQSLERRAARGHVVQGARHREGRGQGRAPPPQRDDGRGRAERARVERGHARAQRPDVGDGLGQPRAQVLERVRR